ncbi:hypothetical protein BH10PLA2_BH10PLA2_13250 [soil metagenome]
MRFLLAKLKTTAKAFWRSLVARRRLALLLIPFGLATEWAQAGDDPVRWTPVQQSQTDRMRNDLELTLRARRLLVEDPVLARYDILVRIDDRVAELTGPVPSMDIAQLAEANLRGLTGLTSIRNRIAIHAPTANAKNPSEAMRGDWNMPPTGFTDGSGPGTQLASRYSAVSSEPVFSWRPVRRSDETNPMPVPFLAEGISRPAGGREQLREADTLNRENLRIGRVDVIKTPADRAESAKPPIERMQSVKAPAERVEGVKTPAELKPDSEIFSLPPINIRHTEEPIKNANGEVSEALRSRVPFLIY